MGYFAYEVNFFCKMGRRVWRDWNNSGHLLPSNKRTGKSCERGFFYRPLLEKGRGEQFKNYFQSFQKRKTEKLKKRLGKNVLQTPSILTANKTLNSESELFKIFIYANRMVPFPFYQMSMVSCTIPLTIKVP